MNTCVDTTALMIPGLFVLPEPERASQLRSVFEKGFDTPVVTRIWKKLGSIYTNRGSDRQEYGWRMLTP